MQILMDLYEPLETTKVKIRIIIFVQMKDSPSEASRMQVKD